jgi:hypothetical protein
MLSYLFNYGALEGRAKQFPTNPQFGIWMDGTLLSLVAVTAASQHQVRNPDGSFPPITGAEVADQMRKATQPPNARKLAYSDPTFFTDMVTELRASGGINYTGSSGPCDFAQSGDAWATQSTLCLSNDQGVPAPQAFWVDAPKLGTLFTEETKGQACFEDYACTNFEGKGAVQPGIGDPDAGAPGCNYGLSDFVITGDAGAGDGGK